MGREVNCVTEDAMKRLIEYPWPGNVRELENQIKRAMVISREDILAEYLFEIDSAQNPVFEESSEERLERAAKERLSEMLRTSEPSQSIFETVVHSVEKTLIQEALQRTEGNQVQASELLGMHRSTLRKKRKDYRI